MSHTISVSGIVRNPAPPNTINASDNIPNEAINRSRNPRAPTILSVVIPIFFGDEHGPSSTSASLYKKNYNIKKLRKNLF